jgi:hypothetical protein
MSYPGPDDLQEKVMALMGYPGVMPPQPAPEPRQPKRVDIPRPKLASGKEYSDWTQKEADDALLWALGPAFRAGLKPPPIPTVDIPSVAGSASDVQNSHMGTAAREIW